MPSTSLSLRLREEWATRWGPFPLQLPDGRIQTAESWLTTVRATAGPEQDRLLLGLLESTAGGEQAAERLLWVLLIPPVDRAVPAAPMADHQRQDRPGIVAAAVWETIRCTRPDAAQRHLYFALVRDATHRLTDGLSAGQRRLRDTTEVVDPTLLAELASAAPAPTLPAEIRLARLLAEAVHAGVITRDEVTFLRGTLLEGRTVAEVAAEAGVTPATLRKRIQRLTRRLGDNLGAAV